MLLAASLRKKSSILDLFTQSTDFPPPDEEPSQESPRMVNSRGPTPEPINASTTRTRRSSIAPLPQTESHRGSLQTDQSRPQSQQGSRPRRPDFARLRSRHASDPQLSTRFKTQQVAEEKVPTPPSPSGAPAPIVAYSAIKDVPARRSFNPFSSRSKSYNKKLSESMASNVSEKRKSISNLSTGQSRPTSANLERTPTRNLIDRPSETFPRPQSSPSIKVDTVSSKPSTSSFFRRKKKDEHLFPLPQKLGPPPVQFQLPTSTSPLKSPSASQYMTSPSRPSSIRSSPQRTFATESISSAQGISSAAPSVSLGAPRAGSLRRDSTTSAPTSPSVASAYNRRLRERSATSTSINSRMDEDMNGVGPPSGRNSTTSASVGRNSIAGLRSLTSRLRHGSEPMTPRYGSPAGISSHTNSFALSRENLALPEREEGESAGKYCTRIEESIPRKEIPLLLAKSNDAFNNDVLRSLLRTFMFYEEPLDISLRKFLWQIDIRGEAQQIERIIEGFAERYHECNPHIFSTVDQVSFTSFSLVILHSDLFNKNNKRKMQRHEYQKNSGGRGIDDEILGYLFDNIQYTEFIAHEAVEEDTESKGRPKLRKQVSRARTGSFDPRSARSDPYEFIIDSELKLDVLRPALKEVMNLEDTYSYLGPRGRINVGKIRDAFTNPGILRLISTRSRPEAYASQTAQGFPTEASQGVVEISVVKIGIIWRKDQKKKKTQRPWQPWIALLTQSQLYIFKNAGWIRTLLEKWEAHQKHPERRLVMNPQIEEFKPDISVRTVNAVALFDSSYDRHKNAFVLTRPQESYEEVLLADSEADLHDWLAKINYASTFTTVNITPQPAQRSTTLAQRRQSQDPFYDSEGILDQGTIDNINATRREAMLARKVAIEENVLKAKEKLEEQLRNARHLQILAPFPSKTRSELLAFGARISHRIRWARYDIWRLKCHKDILALAISYEDSGHREPASPITITKDSPRVTAKAFGLNRFNSKASIFSNSPKNAKVIKDSPRLSVQSSLGKDLPGNDSLSQRPLSSAGSFSASVASQLPSLHLEPASLDWNHRLSDRLSDRPMSAGGDSLMRKVSTVSAISRNEKTEADSPVALPVTPTHGPGEAPNLLTAIKSSTANAPERIASNQTSPQKDYDAFGSPDSARTGVRRSLRETLRESKELPGINHVRGRAKGKGSISTMSEVDNTPRADKTGIARGEGSFRVHGKKASVIMLPNEFAHMSPEDRLKTRQPLQEEDARSFVPSLLDGEQTASRSSMSDFDSSGTYGTAGTSFFRDTSADSRVSVNHIKPDDISRQVDGGNVESLPLDLAASKVAPTTEAGKRLYEAINRELDKENSISYDDNSSTITPRANKGQSSRVGVAIGERSSIQEYGGTFLESASESSSRDDYEE